MTDKPASPVPEINATAALGLVSKSAADMDTIISKLMPNGAIPEDPKLLTALIKAVGDRAKIGLGVVNAKIAQDAGSATARAAAVMATLLTQANAKAYLDSQRSLPPQPRSMEFPKDLPEIELVPDELTPISRIPNVKMP